MAEGGDVGDAKRAIRARMRAVRSEIAADASGRARRSASICAALIDTVAARRTADDRRLRVMLYDPLPGEPDVAALAVWCAANGIATFTPTVAGDVLVVDPGDVDPTLLDVVVVPGLAFTASGERLGQGGGHFDRFLRRLGDDCLRIGVAFDEQLVDELPLAEHDVAVDRVITG